jgi:hypothetical protein
MEQMESMGSLQSRPLPAQLKLLAVALLLAFAVGATIAMRHIPAKVLATTINPAGFAARSMPFSSQMPSKVLWAWQEPEDLRFLDPQTTGVAYLAQTLRLTDHVEFQPRKQLLLLPPNTRVMAVSRIEPVAAQFEDTPGLRRSTADKIAALAQPGVAAIQIDFDATLSQRPFYAAVLRRVRAQLPPGMPLSITALLSWCSPNGFVASLPVDEAVPMHFRLGREARDPLTTGSPATRLCQGSVGVSTDEAFAQDGLPWPFISPGDRVYLFAPHPWTALEAAKASQIISRRETGSNAVQNPAHPSASNSSGNSDKGASQ